jgi:ribonuclease P protein component
VPHSLRRVSKRPRQLSRRLLQPPRVRPQRQALRLQQRSLPPLKQLSLLLQQLNRRPEQLNRRLSRHPARKFWAFLLQSLLLRAPSGKTSAVRSRGMQPAGSLSFPKSRRLTRASEYECVKRDGSVRSGKLLTLRVVPVGNSQPWRAGFVTSRRLGGAAVRNRVRRRLREIVRQHQHHLREGFWIVFVARKDAATAGYRTLEHEWLRLARRASILL